jgi:aminoglycoside phosphotransferase (APT) family kinase protein
MADFYSLDDLDRIGLAVERNFTDLNPARPLQILGRGLRSIACETAGGAVVLIGTSADAARDYGRTYRVGVTPAPLMNGLLPTPEWYSRPSPDFPHGALGYWKLPGETLHWGVTPGTVFARDLGVFMARLHSLDSHASRAAGLPEVDAFHRVLEWRQVVMPVLATRLIVDDIARVETWWTSFAADERLQVTQRAVCHCDLWHDNLLELSGRLSGVLDLAHVEIGDPANDFAAPRYFGRAFMTALISSYQEAGGRFDEDVRHRAQRFYEARELGGLAWAIEHDEQEEVDESIAKLLRGPIFHTS